MTPTIQAVISSDITTPAQYVGLRAYQPNVLIDSSISLYFLDARATLIHTIYDELLMPPHLRARTGGAPLSYFRHDSAAIRHDIDMKRHFRRVDFHQTADYSAFGQPRYIQPIRQVAAMPRSGTAN